MIRRNVLHPESSRESEDRNAEREAVPRDLLAEELAEGGRVLVTRLKYLGDVVLTLPVVDALRRSFPGVEIDYLSRRDGWELLRGDPRLAAVHLCPDRSVLGMLALAARLRRRRYALALDLLSDPRSAVVTFLSGARWRIGGARRIRRHLYTCQITVPRTVRPATEFHLHHLEALGVESAPLKPVLPLSDGERKSAKGMLEVLEAGAWRDRSPAGPRIALHPGGKWEVKRWPEEHFARLGSLLASKWNARIFIMHGPGEERAALKVAHLMGTKAAMIPLLPVRKLAAILSLLDCAVLCDGGAMHVSVAVGTPTVGVFGSSEPDIWFPYEKFGPYRAAHIPIECRPCHARECSHLSCLRELSAETVGEDVAGVLKDSGRPIRV